MPATAEKFNIDYSEAVIVDSRDPRRGAASRTSSPARWNQMQSLVEHFGDTAVAEPAAKPRRKSRIATPEIEPLQTPRTVTKTAPRRGVGHQRFQFRLSAVVMCCTILGLLLLLLGLNGATLALSRQNTSVAGKIRISQEAIDHANKSIAAIGVSPETAQWALAHGWHVANQEDFDEVTKASPNAMAEDAQ